MPRTKSFNQLQATDWIKNGELVFQAKDLLTTEGLRYDLPFIPAIPVKQFLKDITKNLTEDLQDAVPKTSLSLLTRVLGILQEKAKEDSYVCAKNIHITDVPEQLSLFSPDVLEALTTKE